MMSLSALDCMVRTCLSHSRGTEKQHIPHRARTSTSLYKELCSTSKHEYRFAFAGRTRQKKSKMVNLASEDRKEDVAEREEKNKHREGGEDYSYST